MIIMSTDFGTIFGDMKSSFKLAWRNALSYFLANLGMLVAIAVLLGIVLVPVAAIAIATNGEALLALGSSVAQLAGENAWVLGGMALLMIVPLISLFLVVIGSIYGMSKELVATGETKAEHAFSYLRHKFLSFAGAGAMLTLIIVIPPVAVAGIVSILMSYQMTLLQLQVVAVFAFVWIFVTVGLCAMVFPAIVNGAGVQEAFKESYRLATQQFERVFGLLTAVVVLATLMFSPVIIWGLLTPFGYLLPSLSPVTVAIMGWTVVAAFLWLLVLLPMTIIAFVKVYHELTGKAIATQPVPDVPII
jgi:hypothetical protein